MNEIDNKVNKTAKCIDWMVTGYSNQQVAYFLEPIRYLTPPIKITKGLRYLKVEESPTLEQELRHLALAIFDTISYTPASFQVEYIIQQNNAFSTLELQNGVSYIANLDLECSYMSRIMEANEVILKFRIKQFLSIETVGY
jgi:hypothetical protein